MNRSDIIRFQLMTHCFLNKIPIGTYELECLVLLAESDNQEQELNGLCDQVFQQNIYASRQTARNALNKSAKKGLLLKQGNSKKKICLHPGLQLQTEGNILLEFKFIHVI